MRPLPLLLALTATAACTAPDRSLQAFDDCDQMHAYMQRMAAEEIQWRWGSRGSVIGGTEFALQDSDGATGQAAEPPQHSETNVQEAGVDEADLVKTDGLHLYALAGGHLLINQAWPVDEAAVLGKVPVDGRARGMYLLEDQATVVVISDLDQGEQPDPLSGEQVAWRSGTPSALVSVIDVADPAAPYLTRETYVTGRLMATRRIGDELYLVTYEDIDLAREASGRREAREMVWNSEPREWQVRKFDNRLAARGEGDATDTWEAETGPACDCEDTYYSDSMGGTYVANALVLDLSDPESDFEGTAVAGRADTVYASPASIYLAYSESRSGPFTSFDSVLETVVHKFDTTAEHPTYAATGIVPGVLEDQFSLSEQDGVLRIATTDWGTGRDESDVSSGVYTYEQAGGELVNLDHVIGLAPGEAITSARFVGDFGYVATWEVTLGDPLFTFDLSDPADIRQGGALEVTGWSDYLHPLDDGHLIGVGMEAEPGDWTGELAVSVYDVSDLDHPTLADRATLGAWGSEAQTEHHAFTYFAPTQSLTIPSWAREGDTVLEVLQVTPDAVEPTGRIAQPDQITGSEYWCAGIRRSVVIGEWVWAVSNAGMTAARIAEPEGTQHHLQFEGIDPCDGVAYDEGGW